MKVFYLSLFLLASSGSVLAQDLIYLVNGSTISGKVTAFNPDNLKLNSLATDVDSYGLDQVLLVTNAAGDYLVLNGSRLTEEDKNTFLSPKTNKLPSNIIISKSGDILAAETFTEEGPDLLYNQNGKENSVKISETAAVIRRNGTHKLYVSAGQAVISLKAAKPKISALVSIMHDRGTPAKNLAPATATASAASGSAPVTTTAETKINLPVNPGSPDLKMNMETFSKKALAKTEEFSSYLQMISGVNNNRENAMKSINMAVALFTNEEARVEVSSTNSQVKNKYKVRDYLNRLQFKSGQYDKIIIEYADINYASEFKKGADGNYYGVVTFVQKFRGFVDGEVVYGDITKRNLTIVLKHYEKAVEGGTKDSWDVFLADVGVVETKKL